MAECRRFVCSSCGFDVEAWSDGNPYYIDEAGEKQYAYHPRHDQLARCIGNDEPHICLDCGHEFAVDSLSPISACPECQHQEIADCWDLDGANCPRCKRAKLKRDKDFFAVS